MAPRPVHLRRWVRALTMAAAVGTLLTAVAAPANAQYYERRGQSEFNPFGFFSPLFRREPREPREYRERVPREPRPAAQADQTRPPAPPKPDTPPSKRIVVMGSSLSDWLAYGL